MDLQDITVIQIRCNILESLTLITILQSQNCYKRYCEYEK